MDLELTVHGSERIHDRTKMLIKDVLSIIENGAVVTLGEVKGIEYLLFYSPQDRCTKIAVVAAGRTHLISIWESTYVLPKGVLKPNKQRNKRAREALTHFLFVRNKAQSQGRVKNNEQSPRRYMVKIQVERNARVEYCHEHGEVVLKKGESFGAAAGALLPQVMNLASIVEKNRNKIEGKIRYAVCFLDQSNPGRTGVHFFKHKELVLRLEAV